MSDADTMHGWPSEEQQSEGSFFDDLPLEDDGMPSRDAMFETLKAVMDPEIGINIVDLGLVYYLEKADGHVDVTMTLTSMGCPLTELIQQQVELVLTRLPGVDHAEVQFTFTPPWSTDMISDDAREELRAMGFML